MPKYDPNVTTHIITDAQVHATLKALGLKRLKDIPEHIPTVTWDWVLTVLGSESYLSQEQIDTKLGLTFMQAAFSERMEALPKATRSAASFRIKTKEKVLDEAQNDQPLCVFSFYLATFASDNAAKTRSGRVHPT